MSEIEKVLALQRAWNKWYRNATPEERAAASKEALRQMPGQAYLFADDPEETHERDQGDNPAQD